jgi:hypothetical protein
MHSKGMCRMTIDFGAGHRNSIAVFRLLSVFSTSDLGKARTLLHNGFSETTTAPKKTRWQGREEDGEACA